MMLCPATDFPMREHDFDKHEGSVCVRCGMSMWEACAANKYNSQAAMQNANPAARHQPCPVCDQMAMLWGRGVCMDCERVLDRREPRWLRLLRWVVK